MSEFISSGRDAQEIKFTVSNEAQARELSEAWRDILSGERPRVAAAAGGLNEIMERARVGLKKISAAIDSAPEAAQTAKLARFLAGLYNGHDYHFDLTDFRALDNDLAGACIDYLNYNRLGKAGVHTHLAGGGKQLKGWVRAQGLLPRLRLSQQDEHANRMSIMAQRLGREPDALLRDALNDLLVRHEARTYGCLLVADHRSEDRPTLMHAYRLSEPRTKPLCGATNGSWAARHFEFDRLNCDACKKAFFTME